MKAPALFATGLSGFVFGLGLLLSGMTDPGKVVGFLDILGEWKPGLALVMGSAVGIQTLAFLLTKVLKRPAFDLRFHLPTRRDVDKHLLVGAALFGAGWGIAGFCPGPALVSLPTGRADVWLFVLAMVGGMLAHAAWERSQKPIEISPLPPTPL